MPRVSRLPTTRANARRLKRPTYFTGNPCPKGHTAPRLTSSCYCLECNNEDGYKWNQRNRGKRNTYSRRWQGLPEPTRPCPTVCECCGIPSDRELCLDHNHKTGKFRGWLCHFCNTALGMLRDNPVIADAAARYLCAS